MRVCVWMCALEYIYLQRPEESAAASGAHDWGLCHLTWVPGTELGFIDRAAHANHWASNLSSPWRCLCVAQKSSRHDGLFISLVCIVDPLGRKMRSEGHLSSSELCTRPADNLALPGIIHSFIHSLSPFSLGDGFFLKTHVVCAQSPPPPFSSLPICSSLLTPYSL